MTNPNFGPSNIFKIAQKLLFTLYDNTEGDEWKPIELEKIYDNEITGSYDPKNEPMKNNVLQYLLNRGFISLDENHKKLYITYKAKKYVYEFHPAFKKKTIT